MNVTFKLYKNSTYPTETESLCTDVAYLENGIYSCIWSSDMYENGSYNVKINASNVSFHNNGTYTKIGTFGINMPPNSPPSLSAASVTPNPGGWGSVFNFSVNVTDSNDLQNVTVYLWTNETGSWTLVNNQTCAETCINGNIAALYFNKSNYGCENKGSQFYKFNASDNSSTSTNVSDDLGPFEFTLEKDNVEFINPIGNSGSVNRSSNQNIFLAVRINDTTKGILATSNVTAGRFWVTYDDLNWDTGSNNKTTNSSSYMNYTFNPNCTPTKYNASSLQKWKAGILNDNCYADMNSSNYSLTIKGDLINTIFLPSYGVFNDLENVTFIGNVTSDCYDETINDANLTFRVSHESYNYNAEPNPANNNETYYNATWNVTGSPEGNYTTYMNSSRTNYNSNTSTRANSFHHQRNPQLPNSDAFVTPITAAWGTDTWTIYYKVTDDDDTVNVSLWRRCTGGNSTPNGCYPGSSFAYVSSQLCSDCVNQQKSFDIKSYTDQIAEIGNYEWLINATDLYNGNNTTSTKYYNVTKRNVYFVHGQGNESNVSRIGDNKTTFTITFYDEFDYVVAGQTIYFYVTTNGSIWSNEDQDSVSMSSSTPGGVATYDFNPSCPLTNPGKPFYKTGKNGGMQHF